MLNVADIAKFFICEAIANKDCSMSNLKINKLLYYAQGMYLARYGVCLFENDIEAWEHGPVVYDVYKTYERYGFDNIPCEEQLDLSVYSDADIDFLFDVLDRYGDYTAKGLERMSHNEAPWKNNYDGSYRKVIPVNEIKEYFLSVAGNYKTDAYQDTDFIGYHNKEGHLVLPSDWDD